MDACTVGWVQLNLAPELGPARLRRLLERFRTPLEIIRARPADLGSAAGLAPDAARRILSGLQDEARLDAELLRVRRAGVQVLTLEDPGYPARLREIVDPPIVLYVRGRLDPADDPAVALVGTRRASLYGLDMARRLGAGLAGHGVTVVSGLARGIDGAAHEGALRGGGRTLAALGSGLGRLYPAEHEPLAARIAEQGAVLSEYPMDTPPLAHHFPRRNRVISGLSRGVVVVEAGSRSGALITADLALEQGRDVFAVPGPATAPTSHGAHELLRAGARLVTTVDDVLEELGLAAAPIAHAAGRRAGPGALSGDEARVLAAVSGQHPCHAELVAAESGLDLAGLWPVLLQLELKRLVRQLPGQRFVRVSSQ